MREWKSQSHVKWYCKYHIVQPKVPKEGDVRKFEKGGREDPPGAVQPTVGLDEAVIRDYIRNQEEEEKHQEQQNLGGFSPLPHGGGPFEGPSSNHPLCGW